MEARCRRCCSASPWATSCSGIPLDADGEFAGNFFTLLGFHNGFNPFQLIIGVLGLSLILVQGASWLAVKSEGDLHKRTVALRTTLAWVFTALVVVATAATALFAPAAFANVIGSPVGWVFVALLVVSVIWGRLSINGGKDLFAWYGISLSAAALVGIWAAAIFPDLVPTLGPGAPLSVTTASSTQLTLTVMLIIAAIGVPLVLFYHFLVYRIFAGKVSLDGEGY